MKRFWNQRGLFNYALIPFAFIYYVISKFIYLLSSPKSVEAKVICVGNIVIGGGGKTPIVQAIAQKYDNAAIILRGYKGGLSSNIPVKVDLKLHSAKDVGDEALLHAEIAPTYICKDRYKAAKAAEDEGAKVIIMDDGFQNFTLKKDIIYLVFDNEYFTGNGLLIPAGPLRNLISDMDQNVNKVFIINYDSKPFARHTINNLKVNNLRAQITNQELFKNKRVIVFCAIANPQKFMSSLIDIEASIVGEYFFPDHHVFSEIEIKKAIKVAEEKQCIIATTSKDFVKIHPQFKSKFVEAKLGIDFFE